MIHVETISPPPTYPVTLAEVKAHLRIAGTGEDGVLEQYLSTAVDVSQSCTGRRWIQQTVRQIQTAPYDAQQLDLVRAPVLEVTSIEGMNRGGAWITLSNSFTVIGQRLLIHSPLPAYDAIRISYRAGYFALPETPTESELQQARAAVPPPVRAALLQLVGHLYENREGQSYEPRYASRAAAYGSSSLPPVILDLLRPFVLWGT
jgi:uncharacterized phiE125 gp8 family phage protein